MKKRSLDCQIGLSLRPCSSEFFSLIISNLDRMQPYISYTNWLNYRQCQELSEVRIFSICDLLDKQNSCGWFIYRQMLNYVRITILFSKLPQYWHWKSQVTKNITWWLAVSSEGMVCNNITSDMVTPYIATIIIQW